MVRIKVDILNKKDLGFDGRSFGWPSPILHAKRIWHMSKNRTKQLFLMNYPAASSGVSIPL
jgi:hypothetical protein